MKSLVFLSIGMTLVIAGLIGLGFYFITPMYGIAAFWIVMGLELVIMEPINRILRTKGVKAEGETFEKMAKYEKAVGKQAVSLECEYCGELNLLKVDLTKINSFECKKCRNINKVMIQFSTTRVSDPMDVHNPAAIADGLEEG